MHLKFEITALMLYARLRVISTYICKNLGFSLCLLVLGYFIISILVHYILSVYGLSRKKVNQMEGPPFVYHVIWYYY